VEGLLQKDEYLVLEDFGAYVETQNRVSQAYRNVDDWTRRSVLNTAFSGSFSSDRATLEYCRKIWRAGPVPT
jgi:starch phosphorylase